MELQGLHVDGRVFNVKVSTSSNNLTIDFAIPQGVPGRLDAVIGSRSKWFDLGIGHSANGLYNGVNYTVTRTG
jgi:hypothetical protein